MGSPLTLSFGTSHRKLPLSADPVLGQSLADKLVCARIQKLALKITGAELGSSDLVFTTLSDTIATLINRGH